jgi:hypothetical protein
LEGTTFFVTEFLQELQGFLRLFFFEFELEELRFEVGRDITCTIDGERLRLVGVLV